MGNVIHATSRFRAPPRIGPGCPHRFVMDRMLDMRIELPRERRTVMLSDCLPPLAMRVMTFVRAASRKAPASLHCWGANYCGGGTIRLSYDAAYVECMNVQQPPLRVMAQDGIELLGITFIEADTPVECLAPAYWGDPA